MNDALKALKDMLWVLGVEIEVEKLSKEDKDLVNKWNQAKFEKNFELADKLRNEINEKKIVL